jgi:uroporphyrinogen decarboxylase
VVTYIKYQADAGAQTVQIFDSWAAQLSPQDFDIFAGPYITYIIQQAKKVSVTTYSFVYLLTILL